MNRLVTRAIVLTRTDYGEADRILTLLTPGHGKMSALAKGVRRVKSKLAGGIELFSVSEITFMEGRGGLGTLLSTRLLKHYGRIVTDLERTMTGYDLMRQLHRATEDETEAAYFDLLEEAFAALDDAGISLEIVRFWFAVRLLAIGGHAPNTQTDSHGERLAADRAYDFDFEHMAFTPRPGEGRFRAEHIKLLRLAFAGNIPSVLARIQGAAELTAAVSPLISAMRNAQQ